MLKYYIMLLTISSISIGSPSVQTAKYIFASAKELEDFIKGDYEKNATKLCTASNIAAWNYNVDLNNAEKERISTAESVRSANAIDYYYKTYFKGLSPKDYNSESLKRQVKYLTIMGDAALPPLEFERLTDIINEMSSIYGKAKICPFKKQTCDLESEGLALEPDIENIITASDNFEELAYVWTAWRDATGKKIRTLFKEYVVLKNKAAILDGFKDAADSCIDDYETKNLEKEMDKLWNQVKPFYDELHLYVRNKFKAHYGKKVDVSDGLLPAHILGNMHAHSWDRQILIPFPRAKRLDLTKILKVKGYIAQKMFHTANDFYKSMGLADMSMSFGEKAMITKPQEEAGCHASAWDFCDSKDFRISMCTHVTGEDFVTIYHELGHVQYDIQYKDQPYNFRNAPNPGFHEAIGDAIVLSAINPVHLQKLGLISNYPNTKENNINALMKMALKIIAFLPYSFLFDKWRWDVFSGKVRPDDWNKHWWYYRRSIQKVKPPNNRSEDDFDPGSKYHIPSDSPYMAYVLPLSPNGDNHPILSLFCSYFVSHIVQFQIYKGLCIAANQYIPGNKSSKPLHRCDFYQSKTAGAKLKAGLEVGSSVHWSVALEKMTGESVLNTGAILEYFAPLINWLRTTNKTFTKKG